MSVGKLGCIRTQILRAHSAAGLAPIMDKVVYEERPAHCRRGRAGTHAALDPTVADVVAARQAMDDACFRCGRLREAAKRRDAPLVETRAMEENSRRPSRL
jgi:hypothetical protein